MIYKYVLLKSSWGIVIFLDVEELLAPSLLNTDILVCDNVFLRIDDDVRLNKEIAERYISQGIRSLSEVLYDRLQGRVVCFFVKAIEFNNTDFQVEGLYCAIREWIGKYYDIEIDAVKVRYEQIQNKYIFDIPDAL